MNLYLISQTKNNDYDTYDSAVVCAASVSAARNTHPTQYPGDGWDLRTWAAKEYVTVKLIGKAKRGVKKGVVCASFNAG